MTETKTKKFERKLTEYFDIEKAVFLNLATACIELILENIGNRRYYQYNGDNQEKNLILSRLS